MDLPQSNPNKILIYRSAMIPFIVENEKIQMLFMQPADFERGGSEFQLIKGKVETEDQDFLACAKREAKEEAGLFFGNVVKYAELGNFMGRTMVFVCKVKSKDMFGIPSDETGDTKWMTNEQFQEEGRILHKPVIAAAYRLIKKLEEID
ncbi:NUDIX hydrolase [Candidatus Dojkabacteria bacterium]|jgi:8-oxo-dGTP pyrophosphatase MutT (NUDIX family)|nr:NUDIX hydrolase [Candidatus Dojkabacteria bacterium]